MTRRAVRLRPISTPSDGSGLPAAREHGRGERQGCDPAGQGHRQDEGKQARTQQQDQQGGMPRESLWIVARECFGSNDAQYAADHEQHSHCETLYGQPLQQGRKAIGGQPRHMRWRDQQARLHGDARAPLQQRAGRVHACVGERAHSLELWQRACGKGFQRHKQALVAGPSGPGRARARQRDNHVLKHRSQRDPGRRLAGRWRGDFTGFSGRVGAGAGRASPMGLSRLARGLGGLLVPRASAIRAGLSRNMHP